MADRAYDLVVIGSGPAGHRGAIAAAKLGKRVDYILVACGTRPAHRSTIPIDGEKVLDADQIGGVRNIPRDLIVVGAGCAATPLSPASP